MCKSIFFFYSKLILNLHNLLPVLNFTYNNSKISHSNISVGVCGNIQKWIKWEDQRVQESGMPTWQDSLIYIYVFIYINLFTIYKVSTHSTSTNLHGSVTDQKQPGIINGNRRGGGWDIHVLFKEEIKDNGMLMQATKGQKSPNSMHNKKINKCLYMCLD